MVDLWARGRAQAINPLLGTSGATALPCPGGWQDQPAALMDAFALLDRMADEERR